MVTNSLVDDGVAKVNITIDSVVIMHLLSFELHSRRNGSGRNNVYDVSQTDP